MAVLWFLVGAAISRVVPASPVERCPENDETSMLQVSQTLTAERSGIQLSIDGNEQQNQNVQMSLLSIGQEAASVSLVDFVYCWAGEGKQQSSADGNLKGADTTDDHVEGFGFNELKLSIESLQLYAPWFHKVYLLVNGPARKPAWAANDSRIEMVDRCMLFPRRSDCPTKNIAACQSVVHRVPGLLERFVFLEDDFIFIRPVQPSHFFSPHGKPYITTLLTDSQLMEAYGARDLLMTGPDMPPDHVPLRVEWFVHVPMPMTISFSTRLEQDYSEWFAFVRSHKTRFTCCDASIHTNGLAEHFLRIYPAMLHKYGAGVQPPNATGDDHRCDCGARKCIREHLANPTETTLTLQSCHWAADWSAAHKLILEHMNRYSEPSVAVTEPLVKGPDQDPSDRVVTVAAFTCICATDLILALCGAWAIFTAWHYTRSMPAGFLGVTAPKQAGLVVFYISLAVARPFLQHRAGSSGYSFISATLAVYIGKIAVAFLMFMLRISAVIWCSSMQHPTPT
jgi:hypothetical protein